MVPQLFSKVRSAIAWVNASSQAVVPFTVQVGDLVEGLCGSAEQDRQLNTAVLAFIREASLGVPFLFTKGNHDITGPGAADAFKSVFFPFLGEQAAAFGGVRKMATACYRVEHKNALFCFYDAYDRGSLDWLDAELARRAARHCSVVIHPPVVPYGARATWNKFSSQRDKDYREHLLELLGKNNVFVLSGHIHKYNLLVRATPRGGRFLQLGVSSVITDPAPRPQHLLSGVQDYNGDQVTVEPKFSPATEQERRAIYQEEAPLVQQFQYADLPGYAAVEVTGPRVTAKIYAGLGGEAWRTLALSQLLESLAPMPFADLRPSRSDEMEVAVNFSPRETAPRLVASRPRRLRFTGKLPGACQASLRDARTSRPNTVNTVGASPRLPSLHRYAMRLGTWETEWSQAVKHRRPSLSLLLTVLVLAFAEPADGQTRLKLSTITPGTESVQLVYNGDFQSRGAITATNTHPYPAGWSRQADMFADPGTHMAAADNGVVALALVSGGASVCKYQCKVTLQPATDYVLSACLWNFGDSANHVTTVIDLNDAPGEPQVTLSYSDANADQGYFVYRSFNTTNTGTTVTLRAFYDNPVGTGAASRYYPTGTQWDNLAITKATDFMAPVASGPISAR